MNKRLATALAIFLTITLITPSAFLIAPQPVYAQAGPEVPTGDWVTRLKETLNLISTYTNTAANYAQYINAYVLQPIAFVLSGNLMKMLTASVIGFVIGKANGTGVPQFVVDVNQSLQTVGDSAALAYLRQFGTNSNSPFAASVASSLKNDYLSKTSLAGFWAANMNTLARSSPNVNAYLAGNWSQGGVAAWFALTTQTQNNPYTFYQASRAQMAGLIGPGGGGVTGTRLSQLSWGQGFMSWCGAREGTTEDNDGTAMEETTTEDNDGTAMEGGGVNPGDPCMKDGIAGTIKTPGSVIKSTLDKVLGGQQDQIARMGNVGPQITQILGNIATVMQTVQFASQILGGSNSGGLFGVDSPSAGNSRSALQNFTPIQNSSGGFTSGYLGASQSGVLKDMATDGSSGSDKLKLIADYQAAWSTISAVANAASVAVMDLAKFCTTAATASVGNPTFATAATAQADAAQAALTTEIAPVLAQAASAVKASTAALAMVKKVQAELSSGSTDSTYAADLQTLQTMPPTASDMAYAQQDAQSSGGAQANPEGSLTVSDGTMVDQMNLISTNAVALTSVCTPVASVVDTGGG